MKSLFLSLALFTASSVQYVVESSSFGQSGKIAPEGYIPGWLLLGMEYTPELHSDRIILTPPWPGNKKGAAWSSHRVPQPEWLVDFEFRATGPAHGTGNLAIWYTEENEKQIGANSVYTVGRFKGLALSIDPVGGHGGTVRGFLNDGTVDFAGRDISTLTFGHCDYAYRNLGRPTVFQLRQDNKGLELLIDGQRCFRADDVILPPNNHFGLTATSGEQPDSFEVFKFVTSTTMSNTQDEAQKKGSYMEQVQQLVMGDRGKPNDQAGHGGSQSSQPPPIQADHAAKLDDIHELAKRVEWLQSDLSRAMAKVQAIMERTSQDIASVHDMRALEAKVDHLSIIINKISGEQKDWSGNFRDIQNELKAGSKNLIDQLPGSMHQVYASSAPSMGWYLFLLICAQLAMGIGYIAYKGRMEKKNKYL